MQPHRINILGCGMQQFCIDATVRSTSIIIIYYASELASVSYRPLANSLSLIAKSHTSAARVPLEA